MLVPHRRDNPAFHCGILLGVHKSAKASVLVRQAPADVPQTDGMLWLESTGPDSRQTEYWQSTRQQSRQSCLGLELKQKC